MSKILAPALFLTLFSAILYARELPIEEPRVRQSDLLMFYLPSFNLNSVLPYHDNFSIDGKIINMMVKGDNANIYYGVKHQVQDSLVMPSSNGEIQKYEYTPQSKDSLYLKLNYAFLDYFQVNLGANYLQNRVVFTNTGYQDYNFDNLSGSVDLTYDERYSSLQTWYKGMVFIYPEEGFLGKMGITYNNVNNLSLKNRDDFTIVYAKFQQLFHPHPFWTIDLEAGGKSHLRANPQRAYLVTSSVIGTYDVPGEYMLDGTMEIRFLHPAGLFWESPAFWYINSFLFKFSPGLAVGANGGMVGRFNSTNYSCLGSAYISPMVAIRMNGSLLTVARCDIALGSSSVFKAVFSLNLSFNFDEKPANLLKLGF